MVQVYELLLGSLVCLSEFSIQLDDLFLRLTRDIPLLEFVIDASQIPKEVRLAGPDAESSVFISVRVILSQYTRAKRQLFHIVLAFNRVGVMDGRTRLPLKLVDALLADLHILPIKGKAKVIHHVHART